MKIIAAIFAAASLAMPAFAGGMATPVTEPEVVAAPVYVAPSTDWTGFYAGAQLGYGDVGSNGAGLDGYGGLAGVHAGYRRDFGQFVAGAELDWDKTSIDLGTVAGDSLDSIASLKLLAGADMGRALVYGTVGMAKARASDAGADISDTGYLLGAGVDYAITDRLTVGGELTGHRFNDFDGTGVDLDATTIKAKVALRF